MTDKKQHYKDTEKNILLLLGDASTFEKGFCLLVQTYQERLYWHIRAMVNLHDDTDEVLQNTFIKVYRGFKNFRKDAKLYTWLYRIATNEALTFLKKRNKHNTIELDNTDTGIANTLKADSYMDSNEVEMLLQAALDTLPEKQKEVFTMRYYDELSYKEISAMLETSVGGLKASYHHAVKKIESFIKSRE